MHPSTALMPVSRCLRANARPASHALVVLTESRIVVYVRQTLPALRGCAEKTAFCR